jgi:hypothetical protein
LSFPLYSMAEEHFGAKTVLFELSLTLAFVSAISDSDKVRWFWELPLCSFLICPLMRSFKTNAEYFVALLIAGIALAVPNMAWAFGIGIVVDLFVRAVRIKI